MTDKQILVSIHEIIKRGNNAEVKKRSDGSIAVYEVKKRIVAGSSPLVIR